MRWYNSSWSKDRRIFRLLVSRSSLNILSIFSDLLFLYVNRLLRSNQKNFMVDTKNQNDIFN